ncbi:molybdate ABC transporter permease subunit [Psychrobacter pacificensis]|uniref:Molybdenum transport system permease n=1 Tax=Psychrobacter piscatorii TaxID=554343 RepID=A0A0T6DQB6_9GAMM|nr:molybdate ABC transporter permease subunit [Psychrobacter piscatorii]KRU22137.1 molybdenum ABC transporter permease [Psychrobacter piscatorii]
MIDQSLMSDMLSPFWVSIKLASVTTLCLLLFATPVAYWLAKPSQKKAVGRFKILLMGIIAMPLVLPPTVIGFYLLLLLSPSMGIGQWLIEHNISPLIFTFEGLVVGSIIYSLPFYIQPVYAQFLRIPQSVTEVAHLLEPSRLRRFVKVALPQARVGIILGGLISFAHTIGEFGVVLMIGGSISGETKVVSIAIYEQVEALNYEAAHMMSGILIIMGVVMVALIASVSRMSQRP